MRIIDTQNRKDYYDCVQAQDEDRQTIFLRKPEANRFEGNWPFPLLGYGRIQYSNVLVAEYIIGFCGKIYPLIELVGLDQSASKRAEGAVLCRNLAQVEAYLAKNLRLDEYEQWLSPRYRRRRPYRLDKYLRKPEYERFFKECSDKQNAFLKLFEQAKTPVFVATLRCYQFQKPSGEIAYNALLKPFEFFRVFSPPAAYQEISMFVNNLAVPFKPIPKIDDVTMAEAKGFDKFSFRKDPTRKRK